MSSTQTVSVTSTPTRQMVSPGSQRHSPDDNQNRISEIAQTSLAQSRESSEKMNVELTTLVFPEEFTTLSLDGSDEKNFDFDSLVQCKQLKELTVKHYAKRFMDEHLVKVAELPCLEELTLRDCALLTHQAFANLKKSKTLKKLVVDPIFMGTCLKNTRDDGVLQDIECFPVLETLEISGIFSKRFYEVMRSKLPSKIKIKI